MLFHRLICGGLLSVLACATSLHAAEVVYVLNDEFSPTEGNLALIDLFEDRGDQLEFWDNSTLQSDPDGALEAADAADLVFIDEAVGSAFADVIIDTTTPVINNEQFAFDNWGMTDLITGHGSPNRPNGNGDPLDAGSAFGTMIEIVDPTHPIAARAGVSGLVQVYDDVGGRIDWGRPGPEADVVAQLPGFEGFQPASPIFVYEAGSKLVSGDVAPAMRIGFFISDAQRGREPADPDVADFRDVDGEAREATLLTEAGIALLNSTIDYALGIASAPGDFNMNGVLDLPDVNMLSVEIDGGTNDVTFDLNADSLVNDADLTVWVKDLRKTWIGDANLDGEFGSADLVIVLAAGKFGLDEDAGWDQGDWDANLRANSGDLVKALADGGFNAGPLPAATAVVPEPSSLLLVVMGALAAIGTVRQR